MIKEGTCSICWKKLPAPRFKGEIVGNNAEPVNSGRCCDDCNSRVVIVTRIYGAQMSAMMSKLGSMTSDLKKAAVRENGKKGGRPKKGV